LRLQVGHDLSVALPEPFRDVCKLSEDFGATGGALLKDTNMFNGVIPPDAEYADVRIWCQVGELKSQIRHRGPVSRKELDGPGLTQSALEEVGRIGLRGHVRAVIEDGIPEQSEMLHCA
jgi:hypothetical protein